MSNSERQTKLSSSEIRDLVIQAGMQAIPHIGSPLATLYFGIKQQTRFKRLEAFYKEIAQELDSIKDRMAPIEEHDPEALAAIVEKLNETIEREQVRKKIEYLKAYFKNTLMNPVKAIEKEINGQEGYPEYIDWWQHAFAFNQAEPDYYKVVDDSYLLNRVCTDEEADYIFNLLQDKIGIPVLLIEENLELIKKGRPELYQKLVKCKEESMWQGKKGDYEI